MDSEYRLQPPSADSREPRRHHRLADDNYGSKTQRLRNILNLLFIVGCIAGIICFFYVGRTTSYYILIAASIFKFIELTLRIMKI